MCDQEKFENGDSFPTLIPSPDLTISEYYSEATFELSYLISQFHVYTNLNSEITNQR